MKYTVGELREFLSELPDNVPVVTPSNDHSYTLADWSVQRATRHNRHNFSEWFPGQEDEGDPQTDVLVIS